MKVLLTFFLVLFFFETSWALDAQRFKPLNSSQGGWTQYGAGPRQSGLFEVGLYYNFVKNPLEFGDVQAERLDDLLVNLHSFDLLFSYNVTKSWSLLIEIPYNYATYFEDVSSEIEEKRKNVGDIFVSSPFYLGHLGSNFYLGLIPHLAFVSGDEKSFLGETKVLWGLGLALDKLFGRSVWRANLFYREREKETLYNLEVGDFLRAGLSYGYDFGKKEGWLWLSEVNYEIAVGVDHSDINQPLEVLSGLRYAHPKKSYVFNFGLGKGLNSGYGSPDYRLFAGVSYKPLFKMKSNVVEPPSETFAGTQHISSLNVGETQQVSLEPKPKTKTLQEVSETEDQILIQLEKIHFISGSDRLKFDSLPALERLAQILKTYKNEIQVLAVDGHTDSLGDFNLNMNLSRKRAQTVKNFLKAQGVSSERLVTRGFGPSRPIASNSNKEGRYNNRRVEFVVLKLNSAKKIIIKNSDLDP